MYVVLTNIFCILLFVRMHKFYAYVQICSLEFYTRAVKTQKKLHKNRCC